MPFVASARFECRAHERWPKPFAASSDELLKRRRYERVAKKLRLDKKTREETLDVALDAGAIRFESRRRMAIFCRNFSDLTINLITSVPRKLRDDMRHGQPPTIARRGEIRRYSRSTVTQLFISPHPFAAVDKSAFQLLEAAGVPFLSNRLGKKLTEQEVAESVDGAEVLIAGTEPLTEQLFKKSPNLRLIVRLGIGLDNVDFEAARARGIRVAYTPDAPSKAVVELTLALMLNLLRGVSLANGEIHGGRWNRRMGRRIEEVTVGLVGVGRIGSGVLALLQAFGCRRILAHDIRPNRALDAGFRFQWVDKMALLEQADIVSLHVPLTSRTRGYLCRSELLAMKRDALLINTARGGIVDESDLFSVLQEGHLEGVALDVFEHEPYSGPLASVQRCLMTAHMGSMSVDCRARMEREAVQEALRFLRGEPLLNEVTSGEP